MKYLLLILAIIIVSIAGYLAGKYFYKEKIDKTSETSKPLIMPLIEEKKYSIPQTDQLSIAVPSIEEKNINTTKTTKTITTNTPKTLQNPNDLTNDTQESQTLQSEEEKIQKKEINETINQTTNQTTNEETNGTINQAKNTNSEDENITGYYIQLGSFSTIDNAQKIKSQMESLGIYPKIEKIIKNGEIVYRVILGPYKTEEEVLKESEKLKKLGFDNVVKTY